MGEIFYCHGNGIAVLFKKSQTKMKASKSRKCRGIFKTISIHKSIFERLGLRILRDIRKISN